MRLAIATAALWLLAGCNRPTNVQTLYRNSPIDANMRIHFATFDARDGGAGAGVGAYNATNCNMAADVLNANVKALNEGKQPGKFWCEKGSFRK